LDETAIWSQRLSGGEQQRLAIARALLAKPEWLFLDEATSALDPESDRAIRAMLAAKLPGTTQIAISHDPIEADQHLILQNGILAEA
jgi:putative ATP-binding cassette transporter